MFSKINTAVCHGVYGVPIVVETDIRSGLPNMSIVGLPSTTVLESRERIKSAIINSDYDYPMGRITINLTPADIRKNGSALDLPIAVGLLCSCLYVDGNKAAKYGIIGALSLDGEVLGTEGVLPMVIALVDMGIKKVIVPQSNYYEASLVNNIEIIPVTKLSECAETINEDRYLNAHSEATINIEKLRKIQNTKGLDFSDIKGQENAKRAICIAVTGRHGLLMMGSPGCGKTMLAKRIPTIMPEMSMNEIIETTIVYSAAGKTNSEDSILFNRPFRSPHNTIGRAGLLGGGIHPVPGEISLAHNGVLFLDEVCEFDRENIDALRTPIEEKQIVHFRQGQQYKFPCNFQLIMAANPCKCGYYGDPEKMCSCSLSQLEQYQRKLSGPMMDRIDLKITMQKVEYNQLNDSSGSSTSTAEMKILVQRGIDFAAKMNRVKGNANISDNEISKLCIMDKESNNLLESAYNALHLTPRAAQKILKVSRTIADIDESEIIKKEHLAEAMSYRYKIEDRKK